MVKWEVVEGSWGGKATVLPGGWSTEMLVLEPDVVAAPPCDLRGGGTGGRWLGLVLWSMLGLGFGPKS